MGRGHRPRRHQDRARSARQYGSEAICVYMGTGREAVRYGFTLSSKGAAHAEQLLRAVRLVVHGPAPDGHDHDAGQRLHRTGLQRRIAGRVGRPRAGSAPTTCSAWARNRSSPTRDGLWGHALIELMKQRQQAHHGGPAPVLAGHRARTRCCRSSPARTPRCAWPSCTCSIERGPGGPRVRREVVLRLRRAGANACKEYTPEFAAKARAASKPTPSANARASWATTAVSITGACSWAWPWTRTRTAARSRSA